MRYLCIHCGAGGGASADTSRHKCPPSYHCHGCGKKDAMFPAEVVEHFQGRENAAKAEMARRNDRIALTAKAAALYAHAMKVECDAEEYGKMVSRWQVAHEMRMTADEYLAASKVKP